MCVCLHAKSLHLCLTLCNPMDYNPLGSSVMGFSRQEYWSGCHALLHEIFLTQGSNLHLLQVEIGMWVLYH